MVEFAFTFMILVAFFVALLVLGWIFYSYVTITNAARNGSRHLMAHSVLPADQETFVTADAEATWVVTNTVPLLDWRRMNITISPPVANRIPGSYVAVEVRYVVNLPRLEIPLGFTDTPIGIGGPMTLRAVSRRSLD